MRTQPMIPETQTERTMPLGTVDAASRVSSEVCADASKPVIGRGVDRGRLPEKGRGGIGGRWNDAGAASRRLLDGVK